MISLQVQIPNGCDGVVVVHNNMLLVAAMIEEELIDKSKTQIKVLT